MDPYEVRIEVDEIDNMEHSIVDELFIQRVNLQSQNQKNHSRRAALYDHCGRA